jgi:hypothetical protein
MNSQQNFKSALRKGVIICGIGLMFIILTSTEACAWGHFGHGHHGYYFHSDRFYRPHSFWFDRAVFAPPIGAFVEILPYGYTSFVIGGSPYCYYAGVYFRPCPDGYIVVSKPAIVKKPVVTESSENSQSAPEGKTNTSASKASAAPQAQSKESLSGDTVVVNIPNKNGGFTPVTLIKQNDGYIGPQNEFYAGHPTVKQLQALYGN